MANENEVKNFNNGFKMTGILAEKNCYIVVSEMEIKGEMVPCEIAGGEISIETDNGTFPVQLYQASLTKKGEENKLFAGFKTMIQENVSKAELANGKISYKTGKKKPNEKLNRESLTTKNLDLPYDVASYVSVEGNLFINDFVSANDITKVNTSTKMKMMRINRVGTDVDSEFNINMVGIVLKIEPEILKEEETGRLKISFGHINFKEEIEQYEIIIPEHLADDFKEDIKKGDTIEIDCSCKMIQIGGTSQTTSRGRGERLSVNTGFKKMEIEVTWYDFPFDEDSGYIIYDKNEIKEKLDERKLKLEQLKEDAKTTTKKSTPSSKASRMKDPPKSDYSPDDDLPF